MITLIIPCAGLSQRFLSDIPKQYTKINGKAILEHTLTVFLQIKAIAKIIIVVRADDKFFQQYTNLSDKIVFMKLGGNSRHKSVLNAVLQLQVEDNDWVMVHDAARCCVRTQTIDTLIDNLKLDDVGGILAIKATDTVKQVNNNIIEKTINREKIFLAQTPQMFRFHILKKALQTNSNITDEASAIEELGLKVKIILGDRTNIKITFKDDLKIAKTLLNEKY